MRVRRLGVSDPAWEALLAREAHDFYHLPAYTALSARYDGGEPVAFLVEEGDRLLFQPLVIRPLPEDLGAALPGSADARLDATSAYGYPGPLVAGDADFARRAVAALLGALREEGLASAFVRLHPLLGRELELEREGEGEASVVERHGETVVVDLREADEEHWRQTRSGHRNEINRANRAGHRAEIVDAARFVGEFAPVYRQTMERLDAGAYYFFDDAYFAALCDALGDRLYGCAVRIDGELAAGGLFSEVGGIVQYHLSGTDSRFLKERPTKLMLHHVRGWAKARGDRWLHLGGGLGASQSSLFEFKAGFSRHRCAFRSWRLVPNMGLYRALAQRRHGTEMRIDGRGYFPDYRRPRAG